MIKIICKQCKKSFFNYISNHRKFCSRKCKHLWMENKPSWNKGKKCPQWSKEKHWMWKGGEITKICIQCNKSFKVYPYRNKTAKYCSKKCADLNNLPHYGKTNPMWKGGKYRKQKGYIMVLARNHPFATFDGYIRRSRLIMEKHIGRYLKPKEVIHHINSIKDDDRIKNLKLFSSNSEHIKFHKSNKDTLHLQSVE